MPLIRAAFPSMSINDIVGVQPMTRPAGNVYSMNYVNQPVKNTTSQDPAWEKWMKDQQGMLKSLLKSKKNANKNH